MAKLYLQRHLKSQWNLDNRFAGWTDGPLTKDSDETAKEFSKQFEGLKIDKAYCSVQFRSMDTLASIFKFIPDKYPMFVHIDGGKMQEWGKFEGPEDFLPVYTTEKLNERCYGAWQGLNKVETKEKYGEEKFVFLRRSFEGKPEEAESLKDVCERVLPFFMENIEKDLHNGKDVLVVASQGSLRGIVKYVENVPDNEIVNFELPFGALVKYEFDGKEYKKL
jgi:2,3-bisphosphoglycerate-dependent phosphoglycerate mutase